MGDCEGGIIDGRLQPFPSAPRIVFSWCQVPLVIYSCNSNSNY